VTKLLSDVFDGLATSRPAERLTDEGRARAQANAPLEDPRLDGRAIGNSSGWRAVLETARRVASTETTVCLSGDSGTGKELPTLRERREDVIVLAESCLRELSHARGRPVIELTTAARELLLLYEWPGNVRELRNVLERATIVCEDGLIRADDLTIAPAPDRAEENSTDLAVAERRIIQRILRETSGNKARAAQQLGISRTQLYVRLRKYGLGV
jgi:DNA-binding NtrC family response regulator